MAVVGSTTPVYERIKNQRNPMRTFHFFNKPARWWFGQDKDVNTRSILISRRDAPREAPMPNLLGVWMLDCGPFEIVTHLKVKQQL